MNTKPTHCLEDGKKHHNLLVKIISITPALHCVQYWCTLDTLVSNNIFLCGQRAPNAISQMTSPCLSYTPNSADVTT